MYHDCKIYSDGSGYIAILPRDSHRAFRPKIEPIFVELLDGRIVPAATDLASDRVVRETTRKEELDRHLNELAGFCDSSKEAALVALMNPMFDSEDDCKGYVESRLRNKAVAREARSTRFHRKAYLNRFTFYATFTYDDSKCDFLTFDKELRIFFNNQATRHGWKIMMVPEYGKENDRYHFHALIAIPKGSKIPGEFVWRRRYNKKKKKFVDSCENTYFAERWGINDWQDLGAMPRAELSRVVSYVVKYLTKSDAPIYYSRGIPTYICSHIRADDIIDKFWRNEQKAVLFDDFHVFYQDIDVGSYSEDYVGVLGQTG